MRISVSKLTILLPEAYAAQALYYANAEAETDFRDPSQATRCTVCFAAAELSRVLGRLGISACISDRENDGLAIRLHALSEEGRECGYRLTPEENGVLIEGDSRVGVLYGAYALLRLQGVRWYYPGPEGEYIPEGNGVLTIPDGVCAEAPMMRDGRGLDIFDPLEDSAQFLLWMARNRMNCCAIHGYTLALSKKLGMTLRIGGHMFEPLLHPDTVLEDGTTIWQSHREWFGLPADGERQKDTAQKLQFCVSQDSLADYLAGILVRKLKNEWRDLDRLDIWGFDTWGGACSCEKCRALGNGTDRTLHFLSALRTRLDEAGTDVSLVGCAYEGTDTMEPPLHGTPENLLRRDLIIYYPIHRCYAHRIDDPSCSLNREYYRLLRAWTAQTPHMRMMIGEYYNVSKYEDLPLVFHKRISEEIPLYASLGVTAATYMHPPLLHWGVRAMNHLLFSELSWNPAADVKAMTDRYFTDLYGEFAGEVRALYERTEAASEDIALRRNWHLSVLDSLQRWDGSRQQPPLERNGHYADEDTLIESLRKNAECRAHVRDDAAALLRRQHAGQQIAICSMDANNPTSVASRNRPNVLTARLAELYRSFLYAADEAEMFWLCTLLYERLRRGEAFGAEWSRLEAVYERMESYLVPMRYEKRIEVYCDDALTRTQLRGVVDRLRLYAET